MLTVLLSDRVDVVLDIGIAVGGNGHGIVDGGIRAVQLLPQVGHAVLVGVLRLRAREHLPRGGNADGQLVLVGYQLTLLTEAQHLVDHVAVGNVAVGQRGTHLGQQLRYQVAGSPLLQGRIVVGRRLAVAATVAGELRGVVDAVAVLVLQVVDAVEVEVGVTTRQSIAADGGTVDKQVRLDVHIARALRVTAHVVGSVLPVVHQVVHILVHTLHLEVTRRVVDQQDAVERDVLGLHQATGRVSHQALTDDGVLERDILRRGALVVPVD